MSNEIPPDQLPPHAGPPLEPDNSSLPSFLSTNPALLAGFEAFAARTEQSATARNGCYYTEKHALFAKDILDRLHTDRLPIKVTVQDGSIHTIRQHYYEGKKYLTDKLDPTGRYKEFVACTNCHVYDGYLQFHIRKSRSGKVTVSTSPRLDAWKDELDEFIDAAVHGEKFHRADVSFSDIELTWIEARLVGIKELFQNLSTKDRILIIRYDIPK